MAFMPTHAPFVVLGFLFTGFLMGIAGLVAAHAALARRYSRLRKVVAFAAGLGAVYVLTLLGVSFTSQEKLSHHTSSNTFAKWTATWPIPLTAWQ
jgi:hypothetical protein